MASLELRVKDAAIEKLKAVVEKQMEEMKVLKTVMSLPVLRNQLNQYNLQGVMFEDLMDQCQQIIQYAWKGEKIQKPILPLATTSSPKRMTEGSLTNEIISYSTIRNPFTNRIEQLEIEKFLQEPLPHYH